jgi:2-methylcitrate dehydratase PrpD
MATVLKTYNLDDKVKEFREFRMSKDKSNIAVHEEAHKLLVDTIGCTCLA